MFKVLPDFLFFPLQNEMQKWEYHHYAQVPLILDKLVLFDGCPTAKLRKK